MQAYVVPPRVHEFQTVGDDIVGALELVAQPPAARVPGVHPDQPRRRARHVDRQRQDRSERCFEAARMRAASRYVALMAGRAPAGERAAGGATQPIGPTAARARAPVGRDITAAPPGAATS